MKVSIIIPVLDQLAFTRQCLDRLWRNTGAEMAFEVVVVDNASRDGTRDWFTDLTRFPKPVRYLPQASNLGFAKANNTGAAAAQGDYLLFLNNDTLPQPGWLSAMVRLPDADPSVGIVGIKQLFPYTNTIYHTGVVFGARGMPTHLYPHLDASLPQVNQEREYQAVNGACLLIARALFDECGGFDESFRNGYEDTDLCLRVGRRGRKVVCCTSAFIYHYGQISAGRAAADDQNAALFASRWAAVVRVDQDEYLLKDRIAFGRQAPPAPAKLHSLADDCLYLADDLGEASAFTWVEVELARALVKLGAPVFVNGRRISASVPAETRAQLRGAMLDAAPVGGVQIKFAHYWPRHFDLELNGVANLEMFVTNYQFGRPGEEPWDYWMQSLRQNHRLKLPVSEFCDAVLRQIGLTTADSRVLHHGYSEEIDEVAPPSRRSERFRFLTVTNSHDLPRYGTLGVLAAFDEAFAGRHDVSLVVRDYGAASRDTTLRDWLRRRTGGPPIEYLAAFTAKRELMQLYKSCDAFVSAHRGEGFGMKILDAMACGLPVIATLFGGPTSYCTPDHCYPVDFSLVPVADGVDARALKITNQPLWANPIHASLVDQLRFVDRDRAAAAAVGAAGRAAVVGRFSWDSAAKRLVGIADEARLARPKVAHAGSRSTTAAEPSPYWRGVRVSVVVPTFNRKEKLLSCLNALKQQSILPQEFEVVVVDDGSTDGTKAALEHERFPFLLRYVEQPNAGPGAARNRGIAEAAGELVLFIGDDILADERLLEAHLLAHASAPAPGTAILGHLDWLAGAPRSAVMSYLAETSTQQFAYSLIPALATLDHRFFYTSNISLKRQFLLDAADAGIRFDPCFRHAAFEDSEFAFRLLPRGLHIRYDPAARAAHDHSMDVDSFAAREFAAGEMAVVFYRKHPGLDDQLKVRWIGDLVAPAAALDQQPALRGQLEAFDAQTDAQLRARVGAAAGAASALPAAGATAAAGRPVERPDQVLNVIFEVERTRGKIKEWYATVDEPQRARAAQTLASVMRKIDFLNVHAREFELPENLPALDGRGVAGLSRQIEQLDGVSSTPTGRRLRRQPVLGALRRFAANSSLVPQLLAVDRALQERLGASARPLWLERYRRVRDRIRRSLT